MSVMTIEHMDDLTLDKNNLILDMTGYEISNESNDVVIFKQKVDTLYTDINGMIFKKLSVLTNKTNNFKTNELIKLKEDIASNILIPNDNIDVEKMKSVNTIQLIKSISNNNSHRFLIAKYSAEFSILQYSSLNSSRQSY